MSKQQEVIHVPVAEMLQPQEVPEMGEFYNASTGKRIVAVMLDTNPRLEGPTYGWNYETVRRTEMSEQTFTDYKSSVNKLGIDAKLELNLLSGKIDLKGSVDYQKNKENNTNSIRLVKSARIITHRRSMNRQDLDLEDLKSTIAHASETAGATHVATEITYGHYVTMTLTYDGLSSSTVEDINVWGRGEANFGSIQGTLEGTVKTNDQNSHESLNLSVEFSASAPQVNLLIPAEPDTSSLYTAAQEAFESAVSAFAEAGKDGTSILAFTYTPLEYFKTSAPGAEVKDDLSKQVTQVYADADESLQIFRRLEKDPRAVYCPRWVNEVQYFRFQTELLIADIESFIRQFTRPAQHLPEKVLRKGGDDAADVPKWIASPIPPPPRDGSVYYIYPQSNVEQEESSVNRILSHPQDDKLRMQASTDTLKTAEQYGRWSLMQVKGGDFLIMNVETKLCLTLGSDSKFTLADRVGEGTAADSSQLFNFKLAGDSQWYYMLVNNGKVLQVDSEAFAAVDAPAAGGDFSKVSFFFVEVPLTDKEVIAKVSGFEDQHNAISKGLRITPLLKNRLTLMWDRIVESQRRGLCVVSSLADLGRIFNTSESYLAAVAAVPLYDGDTHVKLYTPPRLLGKDPDTNEDLMTDWRIDEYDYKEVQESVNDTINHVVDAAATGVNVKGFLVDILSYVPTGVFNGIHQDETKQGVDTVCNFWRAVLDKRDAPTNVAVHVNGKVGDHGMNHFQELYLIAGVPQDRIPILPKLPRGLYIQSVVVVPDANVDHPGIVHMNSSPAGGDWDGVFTGTFNGVSTGLRLVPIYTEYINNAATSITVQRSEGTDQPSVEVKVKYGATPSNPPITDIALLRVTTASASQGVAGWQAVSSQLLTNVPTGTIGTTDGDYILLLQKKAKKSVVKPFAVAYRDAAAAAGLTEATDFGGRKYEQGADHLYVPHRMLDDGLYKIRSSTADGLCLAPNVTTPDENGALPFQEPGRDWMEEVQLQMKLNVDNSTAFYWQITRVSEFFNVYTISPLCAVDAAKYLLSTGDPASDVTKPTLEIYAAGAYPPSTTFEIIFSDDADSGVADCTAYIRQASIAEEPATRYIGMSNDGLKVQGNMDKLEPFEFERVFASWSIY